jgi:hypothetical protein
LDCVTNPTAEPRTFPAGLALYNAGPDKEFSLTDYISIAMRRGLTEVLTNDKHVRAGRFPRSVPPFVSIIPIRPETG